MADQEFKISELPELPVNNIEDDDVLAVVDVSDKTAAPSGTTKKVKVTTFRDRVDSVFGRKGAVVAMPGDYNPAQVGADPAGSAAQVEQKLGTHKVDPNAHGGTFAPLIHNHDAAYSKLSHNHAGIYAPLDPHGKVPAENLPPTSASPHHIFETQALMLAGGAGIVAGEIVLVHNDPTLSKNGEYVALQNAPSTLDHYDHLGEYVAIHRHTAEDTDITEPFGPGTTVNLQQFLNGLYAPKNLPDQAITASMLRGLEIGKTYLFPITQEETAPGSGINMDIAKTSIVGIHQTAHRYVNALLIRTGYHSWSIIGQEFTNTDKQNTLVWNLDMDPSWPDNTGIGSVGATSFSSIDNDIIAEIGNANIFGAHTLVEKIVENENKMNAVSTRVATLEGGAAQGHVDIIQDFHLWLNNQGPGYLILNDRPADADHIGKNLWDGNNHKVVLKWDEASPFSPTAPFDPAHFEDPVGSGIYHDWAHHNPTAAVWVDKESAFKRMADPVTGAIFEWSSIQSLVDAGSILTVKWDSAKDVLNVLKVEQPTVHVITSPDHQPLQAGGSVDAKSVPFVSLNGTQQGDVKNNAIFMDETQALQWKDNAGATAPLVGVHSQHSPKALKKLQVLTQAQYDALSPADPETIYYIVG